MVLAARSLLAVRGVCASAPAARTAVNAVTGSRLPRLAAAAAPAASAPGCARFASAGASAAAAPPTPLLTASRLPGLACVSPSNALAVAALSGRFGLVFTAWTDDDDGRSASPTTQQGWRALSRALSASRALAYAVHTRPHAASAPVGTAPDPAEVLAAFPAGSQVDGFTVTETRSIPELSLGAIRLTHDATGLDMLHVAKRDTNNAFGVHFSTPPFDSSGAPHILEHVALCGSSRFPVRDPFFKMLNRSLANYMNALTGQDFTMYPFSTTHPADFEHLLDVYWDACFNPLLREMDFMQEGWRLERVKNADATASQNNFQLAGVVFNEMKGAMADPHSLFRQQLQSALYEGTEYASNSGGEPLDIPSLTHSRLVQFHKECYHPANARIYSYAGSVPLETRIKLVAERLKNAERRPRPRTTRVTKWTEPRRVNATCPPDAMTDPARQHKFALAFLVGDSGVYESFVLRVLCALLFDGAASPMYTALIQSGLGTEYTPGAGFDSTSRDACISFGATGVRADDIDKVERTILETLEKAIQEGFPDDRVNGVVHQMELGLKHRTASFGLHLGMAIAEGWAHGANPLDLLEFNRYLSRFRSELASDPRGFWASRIRRCFFDNPHRLALTVSPDEKYSAAQQRAEQLLLESKVTALSNQDKQMVDEMSAKLAKMQDQKEDLSCLPTLRVSDLPARGAWYPLRRTHVGLTGAGVSSSTKLFTRDTDTNGVSYMSLLFKTAHIPHELHMYVPLYCGALTALGTARRSFQQLDEAMRRSTGGISFGPHAAASPRDTTATEIAIAASASCLRGNEQHVYDIMREVLEEAKWDDLDLLKTHILTTSAYLSNSVVDSGHRFAMLHASSQLVASKHYAEFYGGISQVTFMSNLATLLGSEDAAVVSETLRDVSAKIQKIAQYVCNAGVDRMLVVADKDTMAQSESRAKQFVGALGGGSSNSTSEGASATFAPPAAATKSFIPLPLPVYFSGLALPTEPYASDRSAAYPVLARLLGPTYLHREIREKGGAYGGGAVAQGIDGVFAFYAYRDPRAAQTIDTYARALEFVSTDSAVFDDRELDEAKLSVFQGLDAPVSAVQEGSVEFIHGITAEMMQRRRSQILALTKRDISDAASRLRNELAKVGCATLLGDEKGLPGDKAGWKIVGKLSENDSIAREI